MEKEHLLRAWRQVPKLLKNLLATALVGTILILGLRLWPEQIALGEEIGDVLSNVCLAYVGGFIITFLWSHFNAVADNARDAELRRSAIQFMAAAHNCFFDLVISGNRSSPFDCEDYSAVDRTGLDERTRACWEELKKGLEPDQQLLQIKGYQECALDMFKEHFEVIGPFMSHFHPTFVLAMNRIHRELDKRIIFGSNGVAAVGHELSGPLSQFGEIGRHIKWLREVDAQIEKGAGNDFHGAIPRFSREELIARGVPESILLYMEKNVQ